MRSGGREREREREREKNDELNWNSARKKARQKQINHQELYLWRPKSFFSHPPLRYRFSILVIGWINGRICSCTYYSMVLSFFGSPGRQVTLIVSKRVCFSVSLFLASLSGQKRRPILPQTWLRFSFHALVARVSTSSLLLPGLPGNWPKTPEICKIEELIAG